MICWPTKNKIKAWKKSFSSSKEKRLVKDRQASYFKPKGPQPPVANTAEINRTTQRTPPVINNRHTTKTNAAHIAVNMDTAHQKLRNVRPAHGHTCEHCGRQNHYQKVCCSKYKPKRQPTQGNHTTEDAVFDALCSATGTNQTLTSHTCTVSLDHHLYNNLNNCWSKQASQPQFITLSATVHPDDYCTLGLTPVTQQPKTTTLSAMADTGCQSCLAKHEHCPPLRAAES